MKEFEVKKQENSRAAEFGIQPTSTTSTYGEYEIPNGLFGTREIVFLN
jgi:hypothetical protein